jgi:dihydrofolate reductase
MAHRLYVTHVDASPEGDVTFPEIDPEVWRVVAEPATAPDPRDTATYRIVVYERRNLGKR